MFHPRPEREKLFGASREEKSDTPTQGDDDDVIDTPCGVAKEGTEC
jgi:hypothetical protein